MDPVAGPTEVASRCVPTASGYVTMHLPPSGAGTKRPLVGSEEDSPPQAHQASGIDPTGSHLLERDSLKSTSVVSSQPLKRLRQSREGVRRGKWTTEEQAYADRLIRNFEAGLLPLENGATLRAYLSKKLNCDPMRISKKFAGARCLGKQIFLKRGNEPIVDQMSKEEEEILKQLESDFLRSISNASAGSTSRRRNRAAKDASHAQSTTVPSASIAPSSSGGDFILHASLNEGGVLSDDGETDNSSDTDSEMCNPYRQQHRYRHHHNHTHHASHHSNLYHGVAYEHDARFIKYEHEPGFSSSSASSSEDDLKSSGDESDSNDDANYGRSTGYSRIGIDSMPLSSSSMLVIEDIREAMNSLSAEGLEDFHVASPNCVSTLRASTSSNCLLAHVLGFGHHSSDDHGFFPVDFIEPLGEFLPDECFISDE